MIRPYIFFAFANHRDEHNPEYLKELDEEFRKLNDLADASDLCLARSRTEATYERILAVLGDLDKLIRIFHFSGHAGEKMLWLSTEKGANREGIFRGVAKTLGKYPIKLAFLNGCSTKAQAQAFHKSGIPVVIATTRPIQDTVAREFATYFYRSFFKGESIREAFQVANNALQSNYHPEAMYRDLIWQKKDDKLTEAYQLLVDRSHEYVADESLKDWLNAMSSSTTSSPEQEEDEDIDTAPESLGEFDYLRCNRRSSTRSFTDRVQPLIKKRVNKQSHTPQAFFIYGPKIELPLSLSERYYRFELAEIFQQNNLRLNYPSSHTIILPAARDLLGEESEQAKRLFLEPLWQKFRLQQDRHVAADQIVSRLRRKRDIVYLKHDLDEAHLADPFPHILNYYVSEYWNIELRPTDPQFILIFNIEWEKQGLLKRLSRASHPWENVLQQFNGNHIHLLPRLQSVEPKDIRDWKRHFMRDKVITSTDIFDTKKPLPMQKVQAELQVLVKRELNRAS